MQQLDFFGSAPLLAPARSVFKHSAHRPFHFALESLVDAFGYPPVFRIVCMRHGSGYHDQPKCMNGLEHVPARHAYSSGDYSHAIH